MALLARRRGGRAGQPMMSLQFRWRRRCVPIAVVCALVLLGGIDAAAVPAFDRGRLPNGLRYVLVQLPPGPEIVATVLVEAGPAFELATSPGIAYLAARSLMAGTLTRSGEALRTQPAGMRAKITPYVGPEWVGLTIAMGDGDWEAALRLTSDLIRNPAYPASGVEEAARAAEEERRDALSSPSWLLQWHLLRLLAGETGYVRVLDQLPALPSVASPADLRAFHAGRFRPSTTVVAIGAAAPFADLRDGILRAFGDWAPATPEPLPAAMPPGDPPGALTLIVNRPGPQVLVGWQRTAPPMPDGDKYPYLVLLAILSWRLQATNPPAAPPWRPQVGYQGLKEVGWLRVTWQGTRDEALPRVRALFAELRRLRTARVSRDEVGEARARVTRNLEAMAGSGRDLVWHLAARELLGLGDRPLDEHRDVLPAVTSEKLLALARRWLDAQRSATVFIGDTSQMDVLF